MSATAVSIRLGLEGKAEVKRGFEEVAGSGQAAFGQVERAVDRASAASDRQAARLKRLAEAARLAAAADASQQRFNTVLGVERAQPKSARDSAAVFDEAAREAESFSRRASALRAELDPLGAAQDRLNRQLADYAALARRGAITSAEHAAAQSLVRQRFEATEKALTGVGGASALSRQQLMTLQYTFNDVVASMSTGMSPMTILMQQGGQVTQAFGGLRGALAAFGAALGPVGGAIAGVAVAAAGLTAAWIANDASTRAVSTALAGVGRASAATMAELERTARTSADSGRVSVASAREMEVAFLRTGKIGAAEIGRAIALARNFGVTLGVETRQGAEQLAQALADPIRGADDLAQRLAFLDDRTRAHIRTLVEQNDRTQAQRLLLDALAPALADAEQATTALGRAWTSVAREAANAWDAIGRAVDRAVDGRKPMEELELLRGQRAQLQDNARRSGFEPLMLPQVERRIAELERQIDEQQRRVREIAADARANELSVRAGDVARDLTPGYRDLLRLREQEAALRAALSDPQARTKLADVGQVEQAYARVRAELDRYRDGLGAAAGAAEAFRSRSDIAAESLRSQSNATEVTIRATLALAKAWLEGAAAAETAEARRQGLIDQAREGVDAEVRARQALRERIAETASTSAKQVQDLSLEADARRRVNDLVASGAIASSRAQQQLQLEQALRPLLTAQALAEGDARETLARIVDQLRDAYGRLNAEEARGQALSGLEDKRREIELLQRQVGLVNAGVAARSGALAAMRAEQELRQRGVDIASEEGRAYVDAASRIETLGQSLRGAERLVEQREEIALLERQIALVGASVARRGDELAILRESQALRREGVDKDSPEGKAALAGARRFEELTRRLAGRQALDAQEDEIRLLERQIDLVGHSASERGLVIAQLRAEQGLASRGINLASQEGQQIVENAGRVERLTQELQQQDAAYRALENAVGSALDRFGDVLAQGKTDWKSWADAGRSALQDISREIVKLAVMNPLKNALFGGNQPTLSNADGFLGQIFAGVFHEGGLVGAGGAMRMTPALAFAGAPRFHDGGYLKPDEVPAILQRGERVLNRREAADYQRGRGAGAAPIALTFNVATPDASSFRRAQSQITAEMAAAIERARRNL